MSVVFYEIYGITRHRSNGLKPVLVPYINSKLLEIDADNAYEANLKSKKLFPHLTWTQSSALT